MIIKLSLIGSLLVNVLLFGTNYLSVVSDQYSQEALERAKTIYQTDMKVAKVLLEGRVSKGELLISLKSLDIDVNMIELSKRALMVGYTSFIFDEADQLKKLEFYDFSEK